MQNVKKEKLDLSTAFHMMKDTENTYLVRKCWKNGFGTDPDNLLTLTFKHSSLVRLLTSIRDPVITLLNKSKNLRFASTDNESIRTEKWLLFNLTKKKWC